jgi:hypothetical protein
MTLLRINMLKKINKYQSGISGNVKKQFIDLINNLTIEILGDTFEFINKQYIFKKNIEFFNTQFMPILDFLSKNLGIFIYYLNLSNKRYVQHININIKEQMLLKYSESKYNKINQYFTNDFNLIDLPIFRVICDLSICIDYEIPIHDKDFYVFVSELIMKCASEQKIIDLLKII